MRLHILQHVAFESPGSIADWAQANNAVVTSTRFFESPQLPSVADVDFLVVLGGPMSVNDEQQLPWLKAEKRFVRTAVENEVPVLGVCLGAQLVANSLGARVYPNALKEIGWFDVLRVAATPAQFEFPDRAEVMHWHGETFALPTGAVQLARSVACENQAFQLAKHVIGLQFHLEMTALNMRSMVEHCSAELIGGQWIQSAGELLATSDDRYDRTNRLMKEVLDYLTRAIR